MMDMYDYGVITDGGNKVFIKGMANYTTTKVTDKEFEEIENDFDPIETPPGPYKLQPENQGLIFQFVLKSLMNLIRQNIVDKRSSRNGKVYLSSASGKEQWICLL